MSTCTALTLVGRRIPSDGLTPTISSRMALCAPGPEEIAVYVLVIAAIVATAVCSRRAQAEQGLGGDAAVDFALSALAHELQG